MKWLLIQTNRWKQRTERGKAKLRLSQRGRAVNQPEGSCSQSFVNYLNAGLVVCFLLLSSSFLIADEKNVPVQPYAPSSPPAPPVASSPVPVPWLTGPLIAPIGAVVPYGDFEIETYIYATTNTGTYNKNWGVVSAPHNFFSLNPQFLCFFGITPWVDVNIIPQFFYNWTDGQSAVHFGDLQVGLDFQLLDPAATPYFPGIKLAVRETS